MLEFNGEADHIHVLIEYPPKLSISQIVNAIKAFQVADMVKEDLSSLTGKMLCGRPVILSRLLEVRL